VKHPLRDFGAPFLGTKARVIVLLGSYVALCCLYFRVVIVLAVETARFSAPSEQRWKSGRCRSYSYSYSGASKAMESDRDGGYNSISGIEKVENVG
jgi:hypothetical protein